ncbi:MAG TPA: lasso peptide biosynthesis B2 protein [Verrucomicrobiales bacterium]|nr:lasso peptide biosynthesis B2 protein [Verrucomicrobiales bacterium]
MPARLRAWTALSPRERRLVARAVWLLFCARWSLRLRGVAGSLQSFSGPSKRLPQDEPPVVPAEAREIQRALRRARIGLAWKGSCLPEALAGCRMLRDRGIEARVRFSVRKSGEAGIRAHAWIEIEPSGERINRDPSYVDFKAPGER